MSMAHKYATNEQRNQQVQEIIALVKSQGRLTAAQAMAHFALCDDTIRRRFGEAYATGAVIRHDRCGLFRDEQALNEYLMSRPKRLYGQQRAKAEAKALALASNGNDIFDNCRQNWGGYHIHKIFGSARA